jgi:hypothetical protein
VTTRAALRGTPAAGFDVPGLRDSADHRRTGVLARSEAEFASACPAPPPDPARRAAQLRWSTAVRYFSAVIDEAADRGGLSMASILLVQARPG